MALNAAPNFRQWLRQGTNMKLLTNANANRVIAEGLSDLNALLDFDKDSLEALPKACARALPAVEADPDNDVALTLKLEILAWRCGYLGRNEMVGSIMIFKR